MALRVDRKTLPSGIEVFVLTGSLTLGREAQQFEDAIDAVMSRPRARVVADLREVSFVDSAGVGILVGCHGKAAAAGGQFRLAGVAGRALNVLRISKVDNLLWLDANPEESIQALDGAA